jgi:hypothetical protein
LSEKRKWFDRRRAPLPVPCPIVIAADLTCDEIDKFIGEIDPSKNKKIRLKTYQLFCSLADMPQAGRLARNLKIILGILSIGDVASITSDGVTEGEKASLVNLEVAGASQFSKETAQSLLNVAERYQVLQAMGAAFRQARASKG